MDPSIHDLKDAALAVFRQAYCPYSRFPVGAAVLTEKGEIFKGCNVENASYGLTVCAERNAIFQAVANGHRRLRMVVIVTKSETPTMPCGACRQVMNEFGDDILVYSFTTDGKSVQFTSKQLLPEAFGPVPESR